MVIERKHKNKILNIKLEKIIKTNYHERGSRSSLYIQPSALALASLNFALKSL